jgi:hypothetical protein
MAWLPPQTTPSTIETDPRNLVHLDRRIVDIDDVDAAEIRRRAIVEERAPVPIAALIAQPGVTGTVVDATVVAHLRTPVAVGPVVEPILEGPIPGRPQHAIDRWVDPGAGHPVIIHAIPGPVPRGPQISWLGQGGLVIDRNLRRCDVHLHTQALGLRQQRRGAQHQQRKQGEKFLVAHGKPHLCSYPY